MVGVIAVFVTLKNDPSEKISIALIETGNTALRIQSEQLKAFRLILYRLVDSERLCMASREAECEIYDTASDETATTSSRNELTTNPLYESLLTKPRRTLADHSTEKGSGKKTTSRYGSLVTVIALCFFLSITACAFAIASFVWNTNDIVKNSAVSLLNKYFHSIEQ